MPFDSNFDYIIWWSQKATINWLSLYAWDLLNNIHVIWNTIIIFSHHLFKPINECNLRCPLSHLHATSLQFWVKDFYLSTCCFFLLKNWWQTQTKSPHIFKVLRHDTYISTWFTWNLHKYTQFTCFISML